MADLPTHTELSDRVAKDLKKRGFNFVGTTIVYSYLQAVGRHQRSPRDLPEGAEALELVEREAVLDLGLATGAHRAERRVDHERALHVGVQRGEAGAPRRELRPSHACS